MGPKQPENPQAFPGGMYNNPGMTLRDYFAGQALPPTLTAGIAHDWTAESVASYAYEIADAMLKAREAK